MKTLKTYKQIFESSECRYSNIDIIRILSNTHHISDQLEKVKCFISQGGDINKQDSYGDTALIWAITNSKQEEIDFLLTVKDLDVDIKGDYEQTALIIAARKGNIDNIIKIIDLDADWDIVGNDNKSFLDYLQTDTYEQIIRKYPDKAKGYVIKKKASDFNL